MAVSFADMWSGPRRSHLAMKGGPGPCWRAARGSRLASVRENRQSGLPRIDGISRAERRLNRLFVWCAALAVKTRSRQ